MKVITIQQFLRLQLLVLFVGTSTLFGQDDKPDWVYYLVDRSSSMGSQFFGLSGNKLVQSVTGQILQHSSKLQKDTKITLQFFDSSASQPRSWYPLTEKNRDDFAIYFQKNFNPSGSTRLFDTINEAAQRILAEASEYETVRFYIYSDGDDKSSSDEAKDLRWKVLNPTLGKIRELNSYTRSVVITLGWEPRAGDKADMREAGVDLFSDIDNTEDFEIPEDKPAPDIRANLRNAEPGQVIQFQAINRGGIAESFRWDFGDGRSGKGAGVRHRYAQPGEYTVRLTAVGPGGRKTAELKNFIKVEQDVPLSAEFIYTPESPRVGQTVLLSSESTGTPGTTEWQSNDRVLSTARTLEWHPEQAGKHAVTLRIAKNSITDEITRTIKVLPPAPDPAFSYSGDGSYVYGDTVIFKAEDRAERLSHIWTIAGAERLNGPKVQWKADQEGMVSVVHRVSDAYGAIKIDSQNIHIEPPVVSLPDPDFKITPLNAVAQEPIQLSIREPEKGATYMWFIDGEQAASGANYTFTPEVEGTYLIRVVAEKEGRKDDTEEEISVRSPSLAIAKFEAQKTEGNAPLKVRFTDKSEGKIARYRWEFGDGNTSDLRNPEHTYQEPGIYQAKLTVTNVNGKSSKSPETIAIRVKTPPEPLPAWVMPTIVAGVALLLWFLVIVPFVLFSHYWGKNRKGGRYLIIHGNTTLRPASAARKGLGYLPWPRKRVFVRTDSSKPALRLEADKNLDGFWIEATGNPTSPYRLIVQGNSPFEEERISQDALGNNRTDYMEVGKSKSLTQKADTKLRFSQKIFHFTIK